MERAVGRSPAAWGHCWADATGRWPQSSGLALLAASALTRFGVFEAGLASAEDPRYTIEPQKNRLAARRAAGITDDSITTAG